MFLAAPRFPQKDSHSYCRDSFVFELVAPTLVPMDDRSAGLAIFVVATALFAYYTVWVLVTPFIEPGHVVLTWFPDRVYAILIPAYAGACLVALVLALLGGVMLRAKPPTGVSSDKKIE